MENENFKEKQYLRVQKRVREIKGFYWHLFWYLAVNILWFIVIVSLNAQDSFYEYGFWGKGFGLLVNLLFWGIGLFTHWFIVFGRHVTFSKSWEEKKIKELIDKDNL